MEAIEKTIQEIVQNIVEAMGFPCQVEIKNQTLNGAETLVFNIITPEPSFLIGQYGINLQSLQHLLRILVKHKTDQKIGFIIDANSYREEKNSSLERLARSLAEEAVRENREIILRPMSSYERRIVHMELVKNTEVVTESIGENDDRRVVIKPARLV
ncbi:MAG: hypothetical protein NTZ97_02720 [Candidatus Moranbacteria bacterium]|nr:hypothetical protein [Candidatus Moranbacteria bacterium]